MRISWRQRLVAHPEYQDIATWPFLDIHTLPAVQRPLFLRNQKIVAQVLGGWRHHDIAAAHSIDRSLVNHVMERCLGGLDHQDPALTAGLIPSIHLNPGQRRSPLSTLQHPRGARGSLTALLDQLPSVKEGLDKALRGSVQRRAEGQNLLPGAFHGEFIRLLREAQWPSDHYPFTEQNWGYESLRQYFHQRCKELSRSKATPSRVVRSMTTQLGVYEELQMDEQTLDVNGRIDLVLDDLLEPLRLSRLTLACIVDKASDCRLGYHVALTRHPSQLDLLALVHQVHAQWQPMTLTTPGLDYAPGACLPTALGFPYTHVGPGIVRLDNAFAHHAHRLREYVCERWGATLEHGLVAHPKARNDIEHAFDLVSDHLRRFASTTGSHPLDPVREARKHRDQPPRITLRALEEALSVILTQHNVTPQERLSGHSPLDVLQYQMRHGWPRLLPHERVAQLNPFIQRHPVPLLWYRHEKRGPHLNFHYARYNGQCLNAAAQTESHVIIEYDIRDIRELIVYDGRGRRLGTVHAPLSWQRYPHSITTRSYIHKLVSTKRLQAIDPLGGYFAYLLEQRELPKVALEIVRVGREFGRGTVRLDDQQEVPTETAPKSSQLSSASTRHIPEWTPTLAQQGQRHER